MSRFCAVVALVALLAVPAAAADKYLFTLDPSKPSTISITLPIFAGGASTSSPLTGTYSMRLDPPSGAFNTRNWNVIASLDTIHATNTSTMTLVAPAAGINVRVDPGDFLALDWNQTSIPTTLLSGGPNISSNATLLSTAILVSIYDEVGLKYLTNGNQPGGEWDPMNWSIQVSDADWLAVAGTGDIESHVTATYFDKNLIKYVTNLYGRGTLLPEPGTLGLLGLGVVALLRRGRPA